MYTVYILQSIKTHRYYIGHCADLSVRFRRHNASRIWSTKNGRPWKIVRTEMCPTKQAAYGREKQLKSYKGGLAFKRLLTATADGGVPPKAA